MIPADFRFHTNPDLDKVVRELLVGVWGEKWGEMGKISPNGTSDRNEASFGSDIVSWGMEEYLFFVEFGSAEHKRNDPTPSIPAVSRFYGSGNIHSYIHYSNGVMSDVNGSPGKIVFWENGAVRTENHYRNGVAFNPENGTPSVVHYDSDGEIMAGRVVKSDGTMRENRLLVIGREETYNLLQKAKKHDIIKLSDEAPVIMGKSGDGKRRTNTNQRTL